MTRLRNVVIYQHPQGTCSLRSSIVLPEAKAWDEETNDLQPVVQGELLGIRAPPCLCLVRD